VYDFTLSGNKLFLNSGSNIFIIRQKPTHKGDTSFSSYNESAL
jgi:hypothetical protein